MTTAKGFKIEIEHEIYQLVECPQCGAAVFGTGITKHIKHHKRVG